VGEAVGSRCRVVDEQRQQRDQFHQNQQAKALCDRHLLHVGLQILRRCKHERERARAWTQAAPNWRSQTAFSVQPPVGTGNQRDQRQPEHAKLAGHVCIWRNVSGDTPLPEKHAEHQINRRP
jgi:hypothetical protein